ncbi:Nucleolar protein 14 [Trinorchestia longiramus]|nr:Nucleolar protein 14 [Trinorchestia longiramus]
MVFLQLAGVLYPASDFYHPVMSPVKLFLTQLLGEAKMKEPRDVLAALFCATLLLEYIQETKRFCSELLMRVLGLVLCCVPVHAQDAAVLSQNERNKQQRREIERVNESHVPLQWLVHSTLPPPDMLVLTAAIKITAAPPKFQLSMLNDQNLMLSDQFRCTVLLTCLKLLRDLCQAWSELPSVREAFSPLYTLLPLIPTHLYPDEVIQAKEDLLKTLKELPQHPPRMRINRGRPKVSHAPQKDALDSCSMRLFRRFIAHF